MKKMIILGLVLVCAILIGWRVYDRLTGEGPASARGRKPNAVTVAVQPVRTTTMRHTAEFTGTLLPKAQFVVAPNVAGRLERLLVNIGDTVRKGQLIAELDNREYAEQVEQARAELEVAQANVIDCLSALDVAERDLKRSRQLRDSNVVSQSELDKTEASFNTCRAKHLVALAQVRQKEASLEAAKVRLAYTRIHASWEDSDVERIVGERFADEGATLKVGDPIVSVVTLDPLLAVINVIERDFPLVKVGQTAEVLADALPGKVFAGQVARRAPVLQESSRQGRVEVLVPNADGLLAPGMFARVRLSFAERSEVTAVPISALTTREGRQGVFMADPESLLARFVPMSVGITEGQWAEVVEPRIEGLVITLGQHLLEDGSAIALPSDKNAGGGQQKSPGSKPKKS
ncbi:efflux RND transporter periplasmic adaptor subunit [Desulfocurvibacter africanus]|uniref:Efflux transporter, RND family, MFP subunit n=1 Tax=Desulfocurvibacter africanus subsp. africanus str. Walvis Bay TaxID=690850 RepID=F3YYS1_DESAF|nr:efflux RND transporter periplasmic adaptor subunit [Desulfocurvibacter africanus]EGJ51897.1 efflux transporter, RND family, MFP subunit [Desulfocurvibacter africanus subsp. africanus str. Walvis Bay]